MVTLTKQPEGTVDRDAPRFERVTWYKEPHLRKLYFLSIFLLVGSATTGYDGMLLNTSQQMDYWAAYFPENKDANKLGIMINMYNIGSIISFFITPYLADRFGRRPIIMLGAFLMTVGAMITAFANGYGSEFIVTRRSSLSSKTNGLNSSVHGRPICSRFRKLILSNVLSPFAH